MKLSRKRQWCQVCLNIEKPKRKQPRQISLWWAEMALCSPPFVYTQGMHREPPSPSSFTRICFWARFGQIWSEPHSPGPTCVSVIRVTADSWMKRNWPATLELISFQCCWRTSVGPPDAPTSSVHLYRITGTRGWCKGTNEVRRC